MSTHWERRRHDSMLCFNSAVSVIVILCASEVCYGQWWRRESNPFGIATETSASQVVPTKNVSGLPFRFNQITSPPYEDQLGKVSADTILDIFGTPAPSSDTAGQSSGTARENCVCVLAYQCNEDGSVNTAGGGIFDVRVRLSEGLDPDNPVYNVDICPNQDENNPQRCCRVPSDHVLPHPAPTPLPGVRHTRATSFTSFPNGYTDAYTDAYTPTPDTATSSPKPCGTRVDHDVSSDLLRLSNPDDTSFGEFPWMLALLGPNGDGNGGAGSIGNTFQCGASLIHPQVALTAAHCIKNPNSQSYVVRAGEYDTTGLVEYVESLPHQDRPVTSILIPDNYNNRTLANDVALLILKDPFTPADNVGTICMPDEGAVYDDRWCVSTGWGRSTPDKKSSPSSELKKIDLQITPPQICQNALRRTRLGMFFLLDPSFICALGQRNQDTCQGDGGGPVACSKNDAGSPYDLVGVTAWGVGCGTSTPAVYANIVSQRQWISDRFADMGFAFDEPL